MNATLAQVWNSDKARYQAKHAFCKSFDHAMRVAFKRLGWRGRGARRLSRDEFKHALAITHTRLKLQAIKVV